MSNDLLQLPTSHLLNKIGAGSHKPGSGSAAALNGILSCKLLMTVIELTIDPKKTKYLHCRAEFEALKNDIENRINPRLETLFNEDSKQFDKAIQKRKERDEATNQKVKNDLAEESLRELKKSTEIPVEIAKLCIQLAKYAVVVFDKGFRSARGDSGVALGSALSGLTGCVSIISLNLQSFSKSEWTDFIQVQKRELMEEYHILNAENIRLMDVLDREAERKNRFLADFVEIRKMFYGKLKVTNTDIENLARTIQNKLWEHRELIWKKGAPEEPLEVLRPEKVIDLLKYAFHEVETLGLNEHNEEIAGIINNEDFTVRISKKYNSDIVNFTTAHELGHALLHDKLELHRDLPLDGSVSENLRPIEEMQADRFAAAFLMPQKSVNQLFLDLFGVERFTINESTAYFLGYRSVSELRKKAKNKRALSRLIAKCKYYKFRVFQSSLSEIFGVSVEAMAIRLEQLDLVDFE